MAPVELLLFRSTQFGDDQDRPIKKSDGSWTYFAADAAYHMQKLEAADELINIWGGDRRLGPLHRQARPDGPAAARRRIGKDVEAVRLLRHLG